MKSLTIQILFLFALSATFGQGNATISGYINEESSGEPIIGGQVFVPGLQKGASSNEFGFYSLTLPKGTYEIVYRGGGFPNDTININLVNDTIINTELSEAIQIDGVEINAKKSDNVNSTKIVQI